MNCGKIQITEIGELENGFIWINTGNLTIYAYYVSLKITTTDYDNWLGRLEASIRASHCDVIVAGDFNAKHR